MHALKAGLNAADADKFATYRGIGCFRKGFITHLFFKWPLYTLEAAERKYTCAISKHMKTYESG